MKQIIKRIRLWLIKKLRAIPEEKQIEFPKPKIISSTVCPVTLRVTRRLDDNEMRLYYDENTRRWMAENITKDLKRRIIDEILQSKAIRIRYNEEMCEFYASVVIVLDEDRPEWF